VLAEGVLEDGIFNVKALGFPPAEIESTTRFILLENNNKR
jgi:hypothetical protein